MFNLNDMRIRYTSLPVLPVYVHSPGLVTIEYALLDWGSQLTLINAQVARRHNLTGPSMLSQVGTIHLDAPRRNAMRVDFSVESLDRSIAFDLTGIEACEELDISRPAIDWLAVVNKWPHLKMMPAPVSEAVNITLLIGFNTPAALDILRTLRPPTEYPDAPKALLTPLGWCVVGSLDGNPAGKQRCFHVHNLVADHQALYDAFDQFCNYEGFGTAPNIPPPIPVADSQALSLFQRTIKHDGTRYEVGLPWIEGQPDLPNNEVASLKRFYQLNRKFELNDEFYRLYSN